MARASCSLLRVLMAPPAGLARPVEPDDLARVAVEPRAAAQEACRRLRGEAPAPDRRADPLAREVAREPRRIAHQAEPLPGEASRRPAAHHAGGAPEGRERG